MCRQSAAVCLTRSPAPDGVAGLPPVERLRLLPDPRRRRGVRHPFVPVLLVAASAVVAGARSYAAIGQWSASAPQHTLARLGARVMGAMSVRRPPVPPRAATRNGDPRDPSSSSTRSRPRPRPELVPLLPDRGLRLGPDTVRPHPAGAGRADAGAPPRRHCRPAIRARARNAGRWCSATYWMRPGRRAGCRTAWRP
nr:transposase family protein [Kitasatospora sp. MBT63]